MREMKSALTVIKKFLDDRYPDGGTHDPMFGVMVVLFSAALLHITNVDALSKFTGYEREFVDAIACNMINNGLWGEDQYKASEWLREGNLNDQDFWNQIEAACGWLWYSVDASHNGKTTDPLSLLP